MGPSFDQLSTCPGSRIVLAFSLVGAACPLPKRLLLAPEQKALAFPVGQTLSRPAHVLTFLIPI